MGTCNSVRRQDLDKTVVGKKFLLTIDGDWIPGSAPGLEAILELCREYGMPSTIFVAGKFVDAYSSLINEAADAGHEIGAHGWAHTLDMDENFRSTTYDAQREWLLRATESIERATGARPSIFRAPFLQVSNTMFRVLDELEYSIDSSIPARRFDAGFGMINSFSHFRAPLDPYHPNPHRLAQKGSSPIIEVAPSSFIFPVNMTALRILGPSLTRWAARRVYNRASVLNFYCHPWEFVPPDQQEFPPGFPNRHQRSIGAHNLELLRRFIDGVLAWGCEPATVSGVI